MSADLDASSSAPTDWTVLRDQARRFAAAVGDRDMDPDDLTQDAMERVYRARSDEVVSLAYLYTTVYRRVLELRRSAVRRRARLGSIDLGLRTVHLDERPADLGALLDGLGPDDRTVLFLAVVEDWPADKVGQLMGCSEAAARKKLSRARQRFARALEGVERR